MTKIDAGRKADGNAQVLGLLVALTLRTELIGAVKLSSEVGRTVAEGTANQPARPHE